MAIFGVHVLILMYVLYIQHMEFKMIRYIQSVSRLIIKTAPPATAHRSAAITNLFIAV